MREVSDSFLLNLAEVSATLTGLFLVGVFFFVDSGLRRWKPARDAFTPYLRSGTRITLIVFSFPIFLSLTLVTLEPVWSRVIFALLSVILVAGGIDSAVRVRGVAPSTGSITMLVHEIVASALSVVVVILPWALGGLHPSREDLTWSILLAFVTGFTSIAATVMAAFELARMETDDS